MRNAADAYLDPPAGLPDFSGADADHPFYHRRRYRAEDSGSPRRIGATTENRPGARAAAVGTRTGASASSGQRSTMGINPQPEPVFEFNQRIAW